MDIKAFCGIVRKTVLSNRFQRLGYGLVAFLVPFSILTGMLLVEKRDTAMSVALADIRDDCVFITNTLNNTIDRQDEQLNSMAKSKKQEVTVTFYHPNSRGINSDSNPNKTATMTKPIVGWTIAISDELFKMGWLGSKVYIDKMGVFLAADRMGASIKGKCIDICVASKRIAMRSGRIHNVIAVQL